MERPDTEEAEVAEDTERSSSGHGETASDGEIHGDGDDGLFGEDSSSAMLIVDCCMRGRNRTVRGGRCSVLVLGRLANDVRRP